MKLSMSSKVKLLVSLVVIICACMVIIFPLLANPMTAEAATSTKYDVMDTYTRTFYTNTGSAKDNKGKERIKYVVEYEVRRSKSSATIALDLACTPMRIQYEGQVFTVTKTDSYSLSYTVANSITESLSATVSSKISSSVGIEDSGVKAKVGSEISSSVTETLQTTFSSSYTKTLSSSLSLSTQYQGTIANGIFCLTYEILGNRWQVVITKITTVKETSTKHGCDYSWDATKTTSSTKTIICYDTYLPTKEAIEKKWQSIGAYSFANEQAMYNYLNNLNKVAM